MISKKRTRFRVRLERFVRRFIVPSKSLFLTHTMHYLKKGDIHLDVFTNKKYLITKVKRLSDTALNNGGRAGCWEIFGKNA